MELGAQGPTLSLGKVQGVIGLLGFALARVGSGALGLENRVPTSRTGSQICVITLEKSEGLRSEGRAESVGRGTGSLNWVMPPNPLSILSLD